MSSPNQGLWSTLAMFIPLLAVPFLAAIGIPQFTPTAASSEDEPPELGQLERVEIGVGESLHHGADDLFAPFSEERTGSGAQTGRSSPARSESKWDDPFQQWGSVAAEPARESRPAVTLDEPQNELVESVSDWPGQTTSTANAGRQLRGRESADGPAVSGAPTHEWLSLDDEAASRSGGRDRQPRPAPPETSGNRAEASPVRSVTGAPADASPFASGTAGREEKQPAPGDKPLTWQEARRRLGELGIRDFQLNPGQREGEFHFACTFTPPESPRIVHRFEAESSEPLAAVEKVIRQIETWRGRP